MFERWVTEDLDWQGMKLQAGSKVGLLFGSANHDEDVFSDSQRLDLGRIPQSPRLIRWGSPLTAWVWRWRGKS